MPRRGAASMTRLADSAPARCPAERGNAREVAQRPLPSEMMATCRPEPRIGAGRGVTRCWKVRGCMVFRCFLRRRESIVNYSIIQSILAKKIFPLALPRRANQGLHVVQVALECPPARCRQAVLRLGQPAIEGLRA